MKTLGGDGYLVSSLNAKAVFAYHGNGSALVFVGPRALSSCLKQNQQPLAVMGSVTSRSPTEFPKGGGGCGSGGGPGGTRTLEKVFQCSMAHG